MAGKRKTIRFLVVVPLAGLLLLAGPGWPQGREGDFRQQIQKPLEESISIGQKSQSDQNQWEREKDRLLARYRDLKSKKQSLETQNQELARFIEQKKERIQLLEQEKERLEILSTSMLPFLIQSEDNLARLMEIGPPHVQAKQIKQAKDRKEKLADDRLTMGEKYNQTLEAVLAQVSRANTVRRDRTLIFLQSKEVLADVLQVGRLAWFFQTLDQSRTGLWDPAQNQWVMLEEKFNHPVAMAMEMADRQRAADLVSLPLGRLAIQ